ncbi:MAG: phosphoribosylanthranilate isomerase [Planctomycetales bacterium]
MWIKICGIRDVETALAVAGCGPDAIGLNFYSGSPRCVAPSLAAQIVAALPSGLEPVGVFVNASLAEVRETCQRCGLRSIQLHGDEPPEMVAALRDYRVLRAFRVGDEGLSGVADYLEECRRLGGLPWRCLIDARVAGAYGGTGHTAPWDVLHAEYRRDDWPPLILAGGLRPENVSAAIRTVLPWGVDVAGGVESGVACKAIDLVRQFVESARAADGGAASRTGH